jgi:hypothetical protein
VIPEIIKKRKRIDVRRRIWFDVSALRKKMIIENIFSQVDLVIKSIANSSSFNNYNSCNWYFYCGLQESLVELNNKIMSQILPIDKEMPF